MLHPQQAHALHQLAAMDLLNVFRDQKKIKCLSAVASKDKKQ